MPSLPAARQRSHNPHRRLKKCPNVAAFVRTSCEIRTVILIRAHFVRNKNCHPERSASIASTQSKDPYPHFPA